MYRHILAATDGSDSANKAVRHAAALAKATKARLTIVNVTQMWSSLDIAHAAEAGVRNPVGDYEAMAAASAERVLAAAKVLATADGTACETLHLKDRAPAEGIIAAAKDKGCDLIVMGTHGRGEVAHLLLGSVTEKVVRRAACPVLTVGPRAETHA
jgi:nucleotide-binding universal stress UspA family protein